MNGNNRFSGCSEEERATLQRDLEQLHDMVEKLEVGRVEIVVFGEISTGKSALINALVGDAVAQVNVRGGWTKDVWHVPWSGAGYCIPGMASSEVVLIDTATLAVHRRIKIKGKNPEHAVWSPDGKLIYVSAEEADSVDIIDVARGEVVKSVKVGDRPRGIGFLPNGTRAYVAAENADVVNVFDTATNDVITRIKAGKRTNGILVTPDGKRVFATSGGDGTVQAIDPESNTIIAATPIGKRPWNMAITPDGGKLYVACGRSNAVAVVDARTNQKIAEIPVGQLPWGVAIH